MTNSYQPLKAKDYNDGFEENQKLQQESLKNLFSNAEKDDQANLANYQAATAQSKQTIDSLSKFSSTLMGYLTEEKQKQNQKEMNQGLMDAFYGGPNQDQLDEVEAEESVMVDQSSQANKVADKIDSDTGHTLIGQKVRDVSPWRKYGQYVGDVQKTMSMLPLLRKQAEEDMVVAIDGVNISYDGLKTAEEYQAWQDRFTEKVLGLFPGINPALAQKYIFKDLRESLETSAIGWATKRAKLEAQERIEASKDRIASARTSADFGAVWLNEVQSGNLTRTQASQLLKDLVNDKIITQQQISVLRNHEFDHRGMGRTTVGKAFERDFAALDQKFIDIQRQDLNNRTLQENLVMEDFDNQFEEIRRSRGPNNPFNEAEIESFKQNLIDQDIPRSRVDAYFKDYETQEDSNDEDAREYLNKLRSPNGKGFLVPNDLKNFSTNIQNEFSRYVASDAELAENYTELFKDADEIIAGTVLDDYKLNEGEVPQGARGDAAERKQRAQASYRVRFQRFLRSGKYSAQDAHLKALDEVKLNIKQRTFTRQQVVTPDNYKQQSLDKARLLLQANEDAYQTQVLPGTDFYLIELQNYRATGRGGIPQFYYELARNQGVTAWDIANGQLIASGGKGLAKPEAELKADLQDPDVRRLQNYRSTVSRTFRSGVMTGDSKMFLDAVASVESKSYGEYDAYNLGGSNGGYTAIGSGNSSEDNRFGSPLSDTSVGRILDLHSSGQVHAVGRYQFIASTFSEVFGLLHRQGLIDENTKFDAKTQDLFAMTRARQRIGWPGQNTAQGLINEWRGLKSLFQQDPAMAERMLGVLNNEPYMQPQTLMPGITN